MKSIFHCMIFVLLIQKSLSDPPGKIDLNNYTHDDLLVMHLGDWNSSLIVDNNGFAGIYFGPEATIPRHFYPQILNFQAIVDGMELIPVAEDEKTRSWKEGAEFIYLTWLNGTGEERRYKTRSFDVVAHCLVAVADARWKDRGGARGLIEARPLSFITEGHLASKENPYLLKDAVPIMPEDQDGGGSDATPGDEVESNRGGAGD